MDGSSSVGFGKRVTIRREWLVIARIKVAGFHRLGETFHPGSQPRQLRGQMIAGLGMKTGGPMILVAEALQLPLKRFDTTVRLPQVVDKNERSHQKQAQIANLTDLRRDVRDPLVETRGKLAKIRFLTLLATDREVAAIERNGDA
jgi:hypothetical protein